MANIGNMLLTGDDRQVVYGFAGKLIDRLVAAGAASPCWKSREVPGVVIDSERLKVVLIEMLQEAGVTVLTHALGARPIMEGTRVAGVFIESKAGRQAIRAHATIDCTGEADLAFQAGAEMSWSGGSASTLFKLANVDIDAFVNFLNEDPDGFPPGRDLVKNLATFTHNWRERGVLFFPHGGGWNWKFLQEAIKSGGWRTELDGAYGLDALGMYALRGTGFVVINSNFYKIENLDICRLSSFELHAQQMCYYVADFLRAHVPGFGNACVAHIGVDFGLRATRSIHGRGVLCKDSVVGAPAATLADDVIAMRPVSDETGDKWVRQHTYDIPFGITVPRGCENLLVGSAKSVSTEPIAIIRGMTGCMICGQAAGAAGALSANAGCPPADVPIRALQRELLRQDVYLGDAGRLQALGLAGKVSYE